MSHNHKRTVWYKDGMLSLISGTAYGAASIVVGHPMDTVKTKMQAQTNYLKCKGLLGTIKQLYNTEGFLAFYRGAMYPFLGSIIFRGAQFMVFDSVYTFYDKSENMTTPIPHTMGL